MPRTVVRGTGTEIRWSLGLDVLQVLWSIRVAEKRDTKRGYDQTLAANAPAGTFPRSLHFLVCLGAEAKAEKYRGAQSSCKSASLTIVNLH